MNNVAKLHADYYKSTWVQLTNNMFELVLAQSNEVEKAVIGMGEYRFQIGYKSIEISSDKWFVSAYQWNHSLHQRSNYPFHQKTVA